MSEELSSNIAYTQDALAVWRDLQERFERVARRFSPCIMRFLILFKELYMSVANYYTRLRFLWEELSTMTPALPALAEVRDYT